MRDKKIEFCLICGSKPDRCHIKSRGAGGTDDEDNILLMCRKHHIEQHTIGFIAMINKYETVAIALAKKGWFIEDGKLKHPKQVEWSKLKK